MSTDSGGIKYSPLPSQRKFHDSKAAIQGLFGTHRFREECGALSGGDSPELSEPRPDGVDRIADVSDAAGFDACGAARNAER